MKSIHACVFDAFGTLFKTRIPVDILNQLSDNKGNLLLDTWRNKMLEYTWLRNQLGRYVDFEIISQDALTFAMECHHTTDPKIPELLLPVYHSPVCFADVKMCLHELKSKGQKLAILSNGTMAMLRSGVKSAGLESMIDHLFTVDIIKHYKPLKPVYALATSAMRLKPEKVMFISGNAWDVAGAANFGFNTAWINRNNSVFDQLGIKPGLELSTLTQLPDHIS